MSGSRSHRFTLALWVWALGLLASCGQAGDVGGGVQGRATSAACGGCHVAQYEAWQGSTLSRGATSPVFAALVEHVERDLGPAAAERCVRCHEPRAGGVDDPGIGCMACHGAVGMEAVRDGLVHIDLTVPIAGPFGDTAPGGAHGRRRGDLLAASELCGSCHEVSGPGLFVETTWREHEAYRARQQAAGEVARTCVDCHMPALDDAPIVATSGAPVRRRVDHGFVGIDPPWHAGPDVAARAAERTRTLLSEALRLELVDACDAVPGTCQDGACVPRFVRLTNVGAGHAVPTGVSMLRDIWVDVRLLDERGVPVWSVSRVMTLGGRMLSGELEVALITHADRVEEASLAPGESRCQALVWPADLAGAETLEATLRAVAIKPAVLEALGLAHLEAQMPRHEVARLEAPVDVVSRGQ